MIVLDRGTDVDSHELVQAWRLTTDTSRPHVSQSYTLTLPVGRAFNKKIGYSNPWSRPRVFLLKSSDPTMLRLRDSRIDVAVRCGVLHRFSVNSQHAVHVHDDIPRSALVVLVWSDLLVSFRVWSHFLSLYRSLSLSIDLSLSLSLYRSLWYRRAPVPSSDSTCLLWRHRARKSTLCSSTTSQNKTRSAC